MAAVTRWLPGIALVLASVVPAAAAPEARCADELQRGFAAVFAAEARAAEACLREPRGASLEACLDADRSGLVARARERALAAEARSCEGPPAPAAAQANAAAGALVRALLRGLFTRSAPPPAAGEAGRCQQRALAAATACAGTRLAGYERCAAALRRRGAGSADELVGCKLEESGPACDEGTTRAARECAGHDVAVLFPGCATDLARCTREVARHAASEAQNAAAGLCRDVLPGSLAEAELLQCFEPPPPEPVRFAEVSLPPDVKIVSVDWDAGERLFVSFTAPGVSATQLASVGADGSDFRCLTCGSAIPGSLRPVQRFRDGRRVLVAGPNNPSPRWNVLECTPSLRDCDGSQLLPIQLPPPTSRVLQYRVPWVSGDDAWLLWTEVRARGPGGNLSAIGRLVREADHYRVSDARVIAPPVAPDALGDDSAAWRNFTQPFELKLGALRGGRDPFLAGAPSAGQYDTSVIDLETGEVRRLTHHADHDEGVRVSPDERWFVLQSARTDNRVEFLGLLPRPPFIDWTAFSLHFVAIAGAPGDGISPGSDPQERDCYVDPWLIDRWFERGPYLGQRLLRPEDGWVSIEGNAGGFAWAPEGDRVALVERRWRGEPERTRLRIASFPNRVPIAPAGVVPRVPTPEPTWATRYEDWIIPDTLGVTVIPGRVSGTATIDNAMTSAIQGSLEVVYEGYSDDGELVLDGVERIRIPILVLVGAEYEVDLRLSGIHSGSMRGAVTYDFAADVNSGEVVSELDGRVLTGPTTCYEAGLIPIP